jgi:hypothetical protein
MLKYSCYCYIKQSGCCIQLQHHSNCTRGPHVAYNCSITATVHVAHMLHTIATSQQLYMWSTCCTQLQHHSNCTRGPHVAHNCNITATVHVAHMLHTNATSQQLYMWPTCCIQLQHHSNCTCGPHVSLNSLIKNEQTQPNINL